MGHPLDEYEYEIDNFTNCKLEEVKLMKERKIKVAGIVTEERRGVNQRNIEYGRFTLQDYDGTLEFSLNNENYKKFGNLMTKGQVVYVEGIYRKNYNSDNYYFKVLNIKLLDSVGKELTRSITLYLPSYKITEDFIKSFQNFIKQNKGTHKLKIVLLDDLGEFKLNTFSKKIKLNVTNSFVRELKKYGINFKIN